MHPNEGDTMEQKRCGWVKLSEPIYILYHDNEWGKELYDDRAIFELFSLETQSAGLSWLTVLKKRDAYRKAFDNFDLYKVAAYTSQDVERILLCANIIKNKPKVEAIIQNAKGFLGIIQEYGSIHDYFWQKIEYKVICNSVEDYKSAKTTSELSDAICKELKKRGFKFIGSITIYAFMQACGMIDDHENSCFCKNSTNLSHD